MMTEASIQQFVAVASIACSDLKRDTDGFEFKQHPDKDSFEVDFVRYEYASESKHNQNNLREIARLHIRFQIATGENMMVMSPKSTPEQCIDHTVIGNDLHQLESEIELAKYSDVYTVENPQPRHIAEILNAIIPEFQKYEL